MQPNLVANASAALLLVAIEQQHTQHLAHLIIDENFANIQY